MKRLRRSMSDKMLCGVCSGFANYFCIDRTVMRIIAILLAFCGCFSVLAYVIFALIMPADDNDFDVDDIGSC